MTDRLNVVKVENKRQMQDFVSVTRSIYDGVEQYVPDLDSEVRSLFDPKKNPGMKFSVLQHFVAYRDNVPVGRIVGIINNPVVKRTGIYTIDGRLIRLDNSTSGLPAGIYIVDGKKVVVMSK